MAEGNIFNSKNSEQGPQKCGHQLRYVSNGLVVLLPLERQYYDVVMMDVQMPEMDGWQTSHKIY